MRIMEQKFASAKGATHGRNHGCIADLFQLTVLTLAICSLWASPLSGLHLAPIKSYG